MDSTLDIANYIALGRAELAAREELARLERERQAQEQRESILQLWKPMLQRVEQSLPPGFAAYLVEPSERPTEFYTRTLHRPLVLDLSPLGLGPLGAFPADTVDGGVGWVPPMAQADEDTGRMALHAPHFLDVYEIRAMARTFVEALALTQDAAEVVAQQDARPPDPDPYAALGEKGGGCYPVLRVGTDRAEVHEQGAADAARFGGSYGADGWLAGMAVHTFTFPGAPVAGDSLYAYLALVPVAPEKWADLCGGE